LNILGFAYYRVGRFQDTLDMFDRAEPMALNNWPGFAPIRDIFRVMILHRQGHRDEARSRLDQFRRQFQERRKAFYAHATWSGPLLREAETLIDPKPVGTVTGPRPAHQDEFP
jgi:hypothetical protein